MDESGDKSSFVSINDITTEIEELDSSPKFSSMRRTHIFTDSVIERDFMQPKRCCCTCHVRTFLQGLTGLVVLFDIALTSMKVYIYYMLAVEVDTDHFNPEFAAAVSDTELRDIQNNYICIMSPTLIVLILKTYRGF